MPKKQVNIRASKLTVEQITVLADQTGMSITELVSTAIDRMYREETGKVKAIDNQ